VRIRIVENHSRVLRQSDEATDVLLSVTRGIFHGHMTTNQKTVVLKRALLTRVYYEMVIQI
jgi:hypothetical protein